LIKNKMDFTTSRVIYSYKVMPFGLKNTGATFQGMVNEVFKELFVNTMEVYIDNMLMKSLDRFDHVKHLQGSIPSPMKVQCEAQPEKCTFRVASGKFLRYLVTQRGIEANSY